MGWGRAGRGKDFLRLGSELVRLFGGLELLFLGKGGGKESLLKTSPIKNLIKPYKNLLWIFIKNPYKTL